MFSAFKTQDEFFGKKIILKLSQYSTQEEGLVNCDIRISRFDSIYGGLHDIQYHQNIYDSKYFASKDFKKFDKIFICGSPKFTKGVLISLKKLDIRNTKLNPTRITIL